MLRSHKGFNMATVFTHSLLQMTLTHIILPTNFSKKKKKAIFGGDGHRVRVFHRTEAHGQREATMSLYLSTAARILLGQPMCPQTRQESTAPMQQLPLLHWRSQQMRGFAPSTPRLCNSCACSRLFSISWMKKERKKIAKDNIVDY